MTNASENTAAEGNTEVQTAKGMRPTHQLWLVQGQGKAAAWTEITALWPTKSGNGHTGTADKLLPILANHMKGRLVVLPTKFEPEGSTAGGAQ